MLTDLRLLQVEIETLWVTDDRGYLLRSRGPEGTAPYLVIAVSTDGQVAVAYSRLPEALIAELQATVAEAPPSPDPATLPAWIAGCTRLLQRSVGAVDLSSGPGYLVPPGTTYASRADIRRSDETESLRGTIPAPANWSAEEWDQLLDGSLGPWAMAVEDRVVISLCHSARLTEQGAEAGVWTHPAHRGRGYAAAVTAAWASLLAGSGRHLFYSTSADNRSSQRVAARLNLRPLGWLWILGPVKG